MAKTETKTPKPPTAPKVATAGQVKGLQARCTKIERALAAVAAALDALPPMPSGAEAKVQAAVREIRAL